MSRKGNIDDLFRDQLSQYGAEPSPGVWKGIEKRFFNPRGYLIGIISLSLILVLLSIGISAWFRASQQPEQLATVTFSSPGEDQTGNKKESITPANISDEGLSQNDTRNNIEQNPSMTPTKVNNPNKDQTALAASSRGDEEKQKTSGPAAADIAAVNRASSGLPLYGKSYTSRAYHDPITLSSLINGLSIEYYERPASPSFRHEGENIDLRFTDDYARPANIGFGAHIVPGIIFYDANPGKKSMGIDLTGNFTTGKWLLQAGMGGKYLEDIGKYEVQYETYDSVGYYMDVVSFEFATDNSDSIVPKYHETTVYDSVGHTTIVEKNNRYVYLTIPLHVGYRLINRKNFVLYLKGGLHYSLLVYKDEPTVELSVSDASGITVSRQVPGRIRNNWQFSAGLQFGYRFNNRFMLSFEPYYMQYMNNIYEPMNGFSKDYPFVIGIRAGIDFNFK